MNFITQLKNNFSDLKNYNSEKLKGDLIAGLITGIVAIPLSLALAIASGFPPVYGLYTAAVAGFFASLFGGSNFNISGPAAAMVPILASIVLEYGISSIPAITLLAGIMLFLFGFFKIGRLIKYVPYPVVIGFTTGIAITLFFGQLNSFLGLSGIQSIEFFYQKLLQTLTHLNTINLATLFIGVLSLLILVFIPKIKFLSKVPPSLIAIVVSTLIVYFIPEFHSVKNISQAYGDIIAGFPSISFPNVSSIHDWLLYIKPAFFIAFLVSIESLLCAVIADRLTKKKHSPNMELVGQGIGNIASAMFGAMPATAVIARTGTSIKSGSKTRLAGMIHALFVVVFVLVLAPVGSLIPLTTLSSVLFITAWRISELNEVKKIASKATKKEVAVLFITIILTVFFDLMTAVFIGIIISFLLAFKKMSSVEIEKLDEKSHWIDEEIRKFLNKNKDTEILNLYGNLVMGTSNDFLSKSHSLVKASHSKILFIMHEVHSVDLSGLESLSELIQDLKKDNKKVYFVSINKKIFREIEKYGILSEIDGHHRSIENCIK